MIGLIVYGFIHSTYKDSVNVFQIAKGMGTVDFQHKKLDLKPLFPVTLTVLGELFGYG